MSVDLGFFGRANSSSLLARATRSIAGTKEGWMNRSVDAAAGWAVMAAFIKKKIYYVNKNSGLTIHVAVLDMRSKSLIFHKLSKFFGKIDRPVLAACAPHGQGKIAFPFGVITRQENVQ